MRGAYRFSGNGHVGSPCKGVRSSAGIASPARDTRECFRRRVGGCDAVRERSMAGRLTAKKRACYTCDAMDVCVMTVARRQVLRAALAGAMVLALLGLAPFAVALEVHHELAAADTDGHQHSDNDLCQWVQHHTGSSLLADAPTPALLCEQAGQTQQIVPVFLSSTLQSSAGPRAPPRS